MCGPQVWQRVGDGRDRHKLRRKGCAGWPRENLFGDRCDWRGQIIRKNGKVEASNEDLGERLRRLNLERQHNQRGFFAE